MHAEPDPGLSGESARRSAGRRRLSSDYVSLGFVNGTAAVKHVICLCVVPALVLPSWWLHLDWLFVCLAVHFSGGSTHRGASYMGTRRLVG